MNGNFVQELKVRMQQSRDLGRKLYRSPLNHFESIVVYRMYYVPKISFPLSITTFTRKESEQIQSQFYRYALPKMGLNRNTPKALIFGPAKYGCLNLHDIYCKQLELHITKIIQHVRRNDDVGKAFISNIHSYEVTIGLSTPLFDNPPWNVPYAQQQTVIYFLWKVCHILRIRIKIPANTTQRQRYQTETLTIMDDAIKDKRYKYKLRELRAINNCRMYHGIIYPSEMLQYNGREINKGYLYGKKSLRSKTQLTNWPIQPYPSVDDWNVWCQFVTTTYMPRGQWKNTYHPSMRLRLPLNGIKQSIERLHSLKQRNHSVDEYIYQLHPKCQQYLEYWSGTENDASMIWKELETQNITIASDGSHIPGTMRGAGAAVMTVQDDETKRLVVGSKATYVEGMTSLHTEQIGIIAALLMLHVLSMKYGPPQQVKSITHWIDNEEALRRITSKATDDVRLSSYGVRDYADMALMRELVDTLPQPIKINFRKVKSHQTGDPNDLPFEANMNNEVDTIADDLMSKMNGPQNKYCLTTYDGVTILDDNDIPIYDIEAYIREKVRGDETLEYIGRKHNWTRQTLITIDWEGIQAYLKSITIHKKFHITQMMYNWQHIGRQKKKFAVAKTDQNENQDDESKRLAQEALQHLGSCPFQCGQQENHLHYMYCTAPKAVEQRRTSSNKFKTTLQRLDIYEPIIYLLLWGIQWKPGKDPPTHHHVGDLLGTLVQQAIEEQTKIGWQHVQRGFLTKKWAEIQEQYALSIKRTQLDWNKTLVKQTIEHTWNMWTCRNHVLHGSNAKEIREKHHDHLKVQVKHLYKRAQNPKIKRDREVQEVFSIDQKKQLKRGIVAMETWINLAEQVVEEAEKRETTVLEEWLNRENTLQEIYELRKKKPPD